MASIRMSYELRRRIMDNVGKYLPCADHYKIRRDVDKIFLTYTNRFQQLALKQILPEKFLKPHHSTFLGYTTEEFLSPFTSLGFVIPSIYLPKLPDNNGLTCWGEHGWRNPNLSLVKVNLHTKLHIPHTHKCSIYDDNFRSHRNTLNPSEDLLDLFDQFAVKTNSYLEPLAKHNTMYHQLLTLLQKFHTTKQLTDAWPEIEAFIPSDYLSDSIRQKKAKKVPLTLEELKQINQINKELLIQKLLKN